MMPMVTSARCQSAWNWVNITMVATTMELISSAIRANITELMVGAGSCVINRIRSPPLTSSSTSRSARDLVMTPRAVSTAASSEAPTAHKRAMPSSIHSDWDTGSDQLASLGRHMIAGV